jgi:hypothetical protein
MAIADAQSVTITVPVDYLEDVRSALVAELENDTEALRACQTDLVAEKGCREDRDSSAQHLSHDFGVLDQVLAAETDTEVIADRATLFYALEALCRLLTDRLKVEMGYGPVAMGAVLDLTTRLRWAAGEAARIYPEEAGVA